MITLEKAKEILRKHTTEPHLFVHAAAVSAAMGALAEHFGEDKEHWSAIGYLHDVDFEKFPNEPTRPRAFGAGRHFRRRHHHDNFSRLRTDGRDR